jgi:putative hydrolase of the HAD superfamily
VVDSGILNRRFKAAWRSARVFRHTRADWSALVDATFAGLIKVLPSESFFSELYDRFTEPDAWRVYDDVLPTLNALKSRGIKLGIISNWDERLRPLLRRLELEPYFDMIVVSCEVGACKPAPEVFLAACQKLGVAPERILHIGDELEKDVHGARAAGLQAWHLRRQEGAGLTSIAGWLDKL